MMEAVFTNVADGRVFVIDTINKVKRVLGVLSYRIRRVKKMPKELKTLKGLKMPQHRESNWDAVVDCLETQRRSSKEVLPADGVALTPC